MSIKKMSLAIAGAAVLMLCTSVMADLDVTPYGAAQYRFRGRIHSLTAEVDGEDVTGNTVNYHNLFSWRTGLKAKVDDKLSLQFQLGNDWGAGEDFIWANNNMPGARVGFQNLYVHIASFKWNPGPVFVEGGVISLPSNGTLDLLERSINIGHYGEANYQGWSTEANATMLGIKVGVPILKDDFKLGVELFQTILEQRQQTLAASEDIKGNPTAPMFVLTVPIAAGDLKVTPEFTAILNRNYNSAEEKGDHELIPGLSAGYKINDGVSISASGGYGMVSNENSLMSSYGGAYGTRNTAGDEYHSVGILAGVGAVVKAGPGSVQFDFKYNSGENTDNDASKIDYLYTDIRYAYKAHDKFSITPRYRNYYRMFAEGEGVANKSRMENRLELILEGSF